MANRLASGAFSFAPFVTNIDRIVLSFLFKDLIDIDWVSFCFSFVGYAQFTMMVLLAFLNDFFLFMRKQTRQEIMKCRL